MHCMASHPFLTIVTLNTWKGAGDYDRRLALMSEQLAALRPDVLFLQEAFVSANASADTGEALARSLNMAHVHEPARSERRRLDNREVDSTSGLSILSRLPITVASRLDLPMDPRDGERIALAATVRWNDTSLGLVNLHLTYLPEANELRRQQLERIVRFLPTVAGTDAWLLAGDFNAEPESAPLQWLRTRPSLSVADAWAAAGNPLPTITEPEGSTTLGSRCVDHVFLLQEEGKRQLAFADAGRVLDAPDAASGILPSDHAGLRAVLTRL